MQYPIRSAAAAVFVLSLAGAPLLAQSAPSWDTARAPASEELVLGMTPAWVAGLWCGAGLLRDFTLDIAQQTQRVQARLVRKGKVREITGRMDGARLRTDPQRDHTMELLAEGDHLRITAASGALALAKGQFFTRAAGVSCSH